MKRRSPGERCCSRGFVVGGASTTQLVPLGDGSGALAAGRTLYIEPTDGDTIELSPGTGTVILVPAIGLATLTIIVPPLAVADQVLEISTTEDIDSLEVEPASDQTLIGGNVGTLAADAGISWRFRVSNLTWYRRY